MIRNFPQAFIAARITGSAAIVMRTAALFHVPGAFMRLSRRLAATALNAVVTVASAAVVSMGVAAMSVIMAPAHAEKADRDKPLNIEADRLEYDDLKQVNVLTGNVTLTKGTMVIRGDRVVVRQDPQGYQYGEAFGKPATFRQKRDGPNEYIEGFGDRLEYDGKQDTLTLHNKAAMKRLEGERVTDEIYGNLIVYDNKTEFFTVEGGGANAISPDGVPKGRVKVIIQPKPTAAGQ